VLSAAATGLPFGGTGGVSAPFSISGLVLSNESSDLAPDSISVVMILSITSRWTPSSAAMEADFGRVAVYSLNPKAKSAGKVKPAASAFCLIAVAFSLSLV
jgi:hypothetical protein